MFNKIISTLQWVPYYYAREMRRTIHGERVAPRHIYLCICDHFEPYCNGADSTLARKRIQYWLDEYPKVADKYRDSEGNVLKYSFFYPEEEYREEDLNALAGLCHAGFGEVEIHLHHDNDTPENLRRSLIDFKHRLHEKHGLLSRNEVTGEITYGFIHGNWALNNSRHDGHWCGINNETSILLETGCYADFTMPSAPSDTQTRKVNSIYYAVDAPGKKKSHDWGVDAEVGKRGEGLLMVQGPLCLNWYDRKHCLLPRIENSGLYGNSPPSTGRVKLWINAGVSVVGAPEYVFIKLYTHGAQENVMHMLFEDNGWDLLFGGIENYTNEHKVSVHFASAREIINKIEEVINNSSCL
jgi:hypothetical protein